MQKRRNIRLFITLSVLVIITISTWYVLQREEYVMADPDLFAIEDVSAIDSISLRQQNETITLHFKNGEWKVNGTYDIDPQKLTVLFAVIRQVKARRPVAEAERNRVDSLFDNSGVTVSLYEQGDKVNELMVTGDESKGLSYFKADNDTYLVNIPGYRSYLAALFQMESSQWRNKHIFNEVSWNNLEMVEVKAENEDRLSIRPDGMYFKVDGVEQTDSLKLLDYLDRVSLLTADEYVEAVNNRPDSMQEILDIKITDIRNRPFTLSVFDGPYKRRYLALKDSTDWLYISREKVDPLMKSNSFFKREQ